MNRSLALAGSCDLNANSSNRHTEEDRGSSQFDSADGQCTKDTAGILQQGQLMQQGISAFVAIKHMFPKIG